MPEPLTPAAFRADLAEVLHQLPEDIDLEVNPMDAGLDSLRIVTLAERWRERGAQVSFVELAERSSFGEWWELLAGRGAGVARADG